MPLPTFNPFIVVITSSLFWKRNLSSFQGEQCLPCFSCTNFCNSNIFTFDLWLFFEKVVYESINLLIRHLDVQYVLLIVINSNLHINKVFLRPLGCHYLIGINI
ncbi:hypothetical protein Pint_27893 [Pistacia integerrima]|uniref:Uncharacterized protein n=1 Tax=Pistacia integerrima TaxID=434235 RepID=A0ACC0YQX6_9ROSI|nr:hypothetical protein Pint_27893 [Pistacia integerrima]